MWSNLVSFLQITEYNSMREAKRGAENLWSNLQETNQITYRVSSRNYALGPVGLCSLPPNYSSNFESKGIWVIKYKLQIGNNNRCQELPFIIMKLPTLKKSTEKNPTLLRVISRSKLCGVIWWVSCKLCIVICRVSLNYSFYIDVRGEAEDWDI